MKSLSIILLFTLAILTSCTESGSTITATDQYQKDSVIHYILADNTLSMEMADSLISRHPRILQRKLDYSNALSSINEDTDELLKKVIDSIPVKVADKPKTPVSKPVTKSVPVAATPEPVETKQPEPNPEPKAAVRKSDTYQFSDGDFKVEGTSTLHDWDLIASSFTTTASILLDDANRLKAIESLTLTLPVKNLTNKDSKLTKNAWDALNADQHKHIMYKVTSATIVPQQGSSYLAKTTGNLTIAGVTRSIALDATCFVNSESVITIKGNTVINMTDYNVKPPTFMLGAMKTGENVKLTYRLVLNRILADTL